MFSAAALACAAAILTRLLVRAADTQPLSRFNRDAVSLVAPVE
jgi:hypothetical protein